MKEYKTMEELKNDYLSVKIPDEGRIKLQQAIDRAKMEKRKKQKNKIFKKIGLGLVATFSILVILPNINTNIAKAMENMPIIGEIVKVVTFNHYVLEDENHEADINIPQIEITDTSQETPTTIEKINEDITSYTNQIITQFEKDMEENKDGKQSLNITYDVITDTKDWFTLRINILEAQASGYQYYKFYHINKATGEIAALKDIFQDNSNYLKVISENIKTQMRSQMKNEENIYFIDNEEVPENNFETIQENQNFYFNADNELVIVFAEYEVAPGYMGNPEFIIPSEVIQTIFK